MVNTRKIRGLMAERGITQADLAKMLGVSEKTVNTRLKTGVFKSTEIEIMMKALDIEDPRQIFLFEKSHDMKHSQEVGRGVK